MKSLSWLTKAKSIHDLGNHFYIPHGKDWDEDREIRSDAKWLERLAQPLPVPDALMPYFGSRQHDSYVHEVRHTNNEFSLVLNSLQAIALAESIQDVTGVARVRHLYPIVYRAVGLKYARAARYGPGGELRFQDISQLGTTAGHPRDQFRYDWFFTEGNSTQWIVNVRARREGTGRLSSSTFLMVDAQRFEVDDRRRDAVIEHLGPEASELWDALQIVEGKGGWPYTDRDLIAQHLGL